jgi:hypothetical protein
MSFSDHLKPVPGQGRAQRERPGAASWLVWLACVAANGFLTFLWTVFGAAAAGNAQADATRFVRGSIIMALLALAVSVWFMSRRRLAFALAASCCTLPLQVAWMLVQ